MPVVLILQLDGWDDSDLARTGSILRQDDHITARLRVRDLVAFGRFPHSRGRLTPACRVKIDEPLNNLDMKHAVLMMKILRRAADELGKTIVIVLHDLSFASCCADRIVAMRDGRTVHSGSVAEIMSTPMRPGVP